MQEDSPKIFTTLISIETIMVKIDYSGHDSRSKASTVISLEFQKKEKAGFTEIHAFVTTFLDFGGNIPTAELKTMSKFGMISATNTTADTISHYSTFLGIAYDSIAHHRGILTAETKRVGIPNLRLFVDIHPEIIEQTVLEQLF